MKKHTYDIMPRSRVKPVEQIINNAIRLHQQGNLSQAKAHYKQALKVQPENAYALNLLGILYSQKGEHDEGEKLIKKAIKIEPDVADYYSNLGLCLLQQMKTKESESAFKKALHINPQFIPALFGLGNVSMELKRIGDAIEYFTKTITFEPSHFPAYNNLGNLYREIKNYDAALKMLDKVLKIKPDFADAWYNIGLVYLAQHQGDQAVNAFEKAILLKPGYFRAHLKLGDTHAFLMNNLESAISDYERAIAINPRHIPAYLHKSSAYQAYGKFDQSEQTLREAMNLDPSAIDAYLRLVMINSEEADIGKIQSALKKMDPASRQLLEVYFTLGKIYQDKQDFETAFRYFKQGNDYQHKIARYNADEYNQFISNQINTFTREFIEYHSQLGIDTELPVFIVGMPRSGTTLTEQILASHPAVYGTGESEYLKQIAWKFRKLLEEKSGHSAGSDKLRLEQCEIQQIASEYLDYFNRYNIDTQRITEKMPGNYEHLGLISILFPKARIIHCRRNPLDTCLSIYTRHFSSQHSYANHLVDLGMHYRAYQRLTDYWQTVLGERILPIQYEELINDLEGVSRQLVKHIGLEWDPKCLQYHKTERMIKTMSQWQVRQSLYTDSIGYWRHYEPWIAPLIEALGDCVPVQNDIP